MGSCIRVHPFEVCGGVLSAYTRERARVAQRGRTVHQDKLEAILHFKFAPLNRYAIGWLKRGLGGPIQQQRESRGCSGAHFTFFSAQANSSFGRRDPGQVRFRYKYTIKTLYGTIVLEGLVKVRRVHTFLI